MKTTLKDLQEKEAKKKGYYSWRELLQNQNSGYVSGLMEVLAERYANAKLEEAQNKLKEIYPNLKTEDYEKAF